MKNNMVRQFLPSNAPLGARDVQEIIRDMENGVTVSREESNLAYDFAAKEYRQAQAASFLTSNPEWTS
jgi:hypothetical protein